MTLNNSRIIRIKKCIYGKSHFRFINMVLVVTLLAILLITTIQRSFGVNDLYDVCGDTINLNDYPEPIVDTGVLNTQQIEAMNNILTACESGENSTRIPDLKQDEFDEMIFHIGMYYGSPDLCKNIALMRHNTAEINLELYQQVKANKIQLDSLVDKVLSNMYEGPVEYKLQQISDYIANNAKYEYGSNEPLQLLNGGGMCGSYAMLFYKMSTRIGVQTYICHGYLNSGDTMRLHAWNMIELDGKTYHYDITFYDNDVRLNKYLHNEKLHTTNFVCNKNVKIGSLMIEGG